MVNLHSVYNTLIMVNGSDRDFFFYSSDWTNNGYKKEIPNLCIEVEKDFDKKQIASLLQKDSLVSIKDIQKFFSDNPKRRRVIVFIGSQSNIDELKSLKFNPSKRSVVFYLKYLYLYLLDQKETLICLNIMNSLFPHYELLSEFNFSSKQINTYFNYFSEEKKQDYLNSLPFIFKTTSFVKEYSFDPNNIKVKDFDRFLMALKLKDYELVESFLLCESFLNKFPKHKLFLKFAQMIREFDLIQKNNIFNLIKDKILFFEKDKYDLFESFSSCFCFYSSLDNAFVYPDLKSLLLPLSSESLKSFFFIHSNEFDLDGIKNQEKKEIVSYFKEFCSNYLLSLHNLELNPVEKIPLLELVANEEYSNFYNNESNQFIEINLEVTLFEDNINSFSEDDDDYEDNDYDEDDNLNVKEVLLKDYSFDKISASENIISDLYFSHCFFSAADGILDLSSFPKLNYLFLNNCVNLKGLIFNSEVESIKIRNFEYVENLIFDRDLYSYDKEKELLFKK